MKIGVSRFAFGSGLLIPAVLSALASPPGCADTPSLPPPAESTGQSLVEADTAETPEAALDRELATLTGDADWSSDARGVIWDLAGTAECVSCGTVSSLELRDDPRMDLEPRLQWTHVQLTPFEGDGTDASGSCPLAYQSYGPPEWMGQPTVGHAPNFRSGDNVCVALQFDGVNRIWYPAYPGYYVVAEDGTTIVHGRRVEWEPFRDILRDAIAARSVSESP